MGKTVKFKHVIFKKFVNIGTNIYLRNKVSWHRDSKYKLEKHKPYIILCNHQTDFDPVMLSTVFNRPVYFVCTDTAFNKPWLTWMMRNWFGAIPKHKGSVDTKCVRTILSAMKENGVVGIFPEGNRTIAEYQFSVDSSIAKLIKKSGAELIIYNLHGGTGVYPRFAPGPRKGYITGNVKMVLKKDDYMSMSDEELTNLIKENIRVFDSEEGVNIQTENSAEYLERLLFVCPKCGHLHTIVSEKDHVKCTHCGLDVIYDNTLHFRSDDPSFKYSILNEWFQYQKEFVRNMPIDDGVIFEDENVKLFTSEVNVKRELVSEGSIKLTKDALIFYDKEFNVHNIEIASFISGVKFNFTIEGKTYLVEGHEKFNALKYVFMFNKLDTLMKENKTDIYYNLD